MSLGTQWLSKCSISLLSQDGPQECFDSWSLYLPLLRASPPSRRKWRFPPSYPSLNLLILSLPPLLYNPCYFPYDLFLGIPLVQGQKVVRSALGILSVFWDPMFLPESITPISTSPISL
jgi:hypothetical protein